MLPKGRLTPFSKLYNCKNQGRRMDAERLSDRQRINIEKS